jgi:phage-related protein
MPDFPAFPRLGLGDYGPVAPGSSRLARPAVLTAGFGGRYSQRTGDGINALPRDFAFRSPKLRADQIEALDAFLLGRRGYLPFTFLVPGEARPRQFICPEWTTDYADRCKSTLTAKFEENFDP